MKLFIRLGHLLCLVRGSLAPALLLVACPALAQQLVIEPSSITIGEGAVITAVGPDGKTKIYARPELADPEAKATIHCFDWVDPEKPDAPPRFVGASFIPSAPGTYKIVAAVAVDGLAKLIRTTIQVEGPAPPPSPPPQPGPGPPAPAFGPLSQMLILYDSRTPSGREPFDQAEWRPLAASLVPTGPDGVPAWRGWDWEADPSTQTLPGWEPLKRRAMASVDRSEGPHLFAFDAKGEMRSLKIVPGETAAGLAAKVKELK